MLDGLTRFLPAAQREEDDVSVSFRQNPTLKHMLEGLGVPHTEIAGVRVNGAPVNLSYQVQDGDRVEALPVTELELPAEELRFVLDIHLGRLAVYLRLLGFDTLYRNDYPDQELARICSEENRILLTRDRGLLMRKMVLRGMCVLPDDPLDQLDAVVKRFKLAGRVHPFQRCSHCNTLLQPVQKEKIEQQLEPLTKIYYEYFHICPQCGQIYWRGSHFQRMEVWVKKYL